MVSNRTATAACRWVTLLCAVAIAGCSLPTAPRSVARGLQSEDPSVRAQSAVRAAETDDRQSLPLLVERLEDDSPDVRMLAIEALRRMTGEDFGYRFYADESQRAASVRQWREWLKANPSAQAGD